MNKEELAQLEEIANHREDRLERGYNDYANELADAVISLLDHIKELQEQKAVAKVNTNCKMHTDLDNAPVEWYRFSQEPHCFWCVESWYFGDLNDEQQEHIAKLEGENKTLKEQKEAAKETLLAVRSYTMGLIRSKINETLNKIEPEVNWFIQDKETEYK